MRVVSMGAGSADAIPHGWLGAFLPSSRPFVQPRLQRKRHQNPGYYN
jgi:hypothetical protein